MVKICLCAIFRNESKNVYRCLDGAKKIIDCVSICDTGSTDNTVELIKKWGKENNIPTKVHYKEFKNFGHNRTMSVVLAKRSFKDIDYFLLVDADMVLVVENGWDDIKHTLNEGSYLLKQKTYYMEYWNTRLIRADLIWRCVGVTHEYWDCTSDNVKGIKIHELWIDDKEDGGCKDDKFERDKRLLEEGLINEKDESLRGRYMFYLAQTYKSLEEYNNSIEMYKRRIEHGGWNEELFYSQFQIAECYKKLKDYEKAVGEYLLAWNIRPQRSEPLSKIAELYRKNEQYFLSYTFAKIGINIPYPENDTLFIDHNAYLYSFHHEISICSYYIAQKSSTEEAKNILLLEGKRACEYLLSLNEKLPDHLIELAKSNIKFYQ